MTQALTSSIGVVQRAVSGQLRAVDYLRVSTEEQTKGYGITYTGKKTAAHIRRKGWDHVGTFKDEGESGTLPWQERPDAKRLMAMARQKPRSFDLVTVYETRALGREERAFYRWYWELEDLGIFVAVVDEDIDTTTEEGKARMRDKANEAFKELIRIRKRTQDGLQEKAEDGGWVGGQPAYGLQIKNQGKKGESLLEVNPLEAIVLEKAAELIVDQGKSADATAAALNALGYRTRTGSQWTGGNLKAKFANTAMHGVVIFRNTDPKLNKTRGKRATRMDRDGTPAHGPTVEIPCPTPLPIERLRAVRKALERRAKPKSVTGQIYSLSTRLTGACGAHYVGQYLKEEGRRAYRCAGSKAHGCGDSIILADEVEEAVWESLADYLSNEDTLRQLSERWIGDIPDHREQFRARVETLDAEIEKLTNDSAQKLLALTLGESDIPEAVLQAAMAGLNKQIGDKQKERELAAQMLGDAERAATRAADIASLVELARMNLKQITGERRADIIEFMGIRAVVTGPVPVRHGGRACSIEAWFARQSQGVLDLTDELWEEVAKRVPPYHVRKNSLNPRDVVEAVLYKLRSGTGWESLPERFPPGTSVQARVKSWISSGAWERMMEPLFSPQAERFGQALLPPLKVTGELDPNLAILVDGGNILDLDSAKHTSR
ncbi:recombinase family protein [Streptomyces sp. NPDC014864]|uniref:recombinase family protein n=1 Tax=Streptomyces sp. NPDC014864 TaxID=3364924 RepID=UPI003702645D